jgi:hypothetical protein
MGMYMFVFVWAFQKRKNDFPKAFMIGPRAYRKVRDWGS